MAFLRVIPTASHRKVLSWFVTCLDQLPPQPQSVAPPSAEAAHDTRCVSSSYCRPALAFRYLDRSARHSRLGPGHSERTKSRTRELGGPHLGCWRCGRSREARLALPDFSKQQPPDHPFGRQSVLKGGSHAQTCSGHHHRLRHNLSPFLRRAGLPPSVSRFSPPMANRLQD